MEPKYVIGKIKEATWKESKIAKKVGKCQPYLHLRIDVPQITFNGVKTKYLFVPVPTLSQTPFVIQPLDLLQKVTNTKISIKGGKEIGKFTVLGSKIKSLVGKEVPLLVDEIEFFGGIRLRARVCRWGQK